MPTYEYECLQCRERMDIVQKFSDPALTICSLCGGELRKIFSAVGIVFKGSGFYKNDSRDATPAKTPVGTAKDTPATTSSAPNTTPNTTPSSTTTSVSNPSTATTST